MCKLGKIRRRHWKERFKIITIAKFESNLLKANGDRAPRSCEIFQTFCRDGHWCWGASLGAQFSQVWGHNFPKYTLARVRRIQSTCHLQHLYLAMLPIWRRFFHYGVDRFSLTGPCRSPSKIEKTVFRQRTPRSTIWTPGTGYGRVDWNRSWYPSLLAGKRYSDTVFNIGSDLPVDQCDATFNSFLANGWRRGSRMALDHSLSLLYSLNSGLKIRLLPPLLCIAFVTSASCAYVFGRL